MYQVMDAHPLTVIIVVATMLITPFYLLATYLYSGARLQKGLVLGIACAVLGAVMTWVCLSTLPARLGLPGNLIVPLAWLLPSLVLVIYRNWIISIPLSQKWLIGLQLFRVIGAVFLLEMARGNLPGIFAYPAGVGDILVALIAAWVLWTCRNRYQLPRPAVILVTIAGLADFASAFFFGFFSSETPLQLFFPEVPNQVTLFPTGMIPLFFVPYAIFFHTLSILTLARNQSESVM